MYYLFFLHVLFLFINLIVILEIIRKTDNLDKDILIIIFLLLCPIISNIVYFLFIYRKDLEYNYENIKYNNSNFIYIDSGVETFNYMKKYLSMAEDFIFLDYFSIKNSLMWNNLLKILIEKIKNKVDVRIIYDSYGSKISKKYKRYLESLGISLLEYNKINFNLGKSNIRDHRKMMIIDNKYIIIGSSNLEDKHINKDKNSPYYKDSNILLTGEIVDFYTKLFLKTWYKYMKYDNFKYKKYKVESKLFLMPIYSDNKNKYARKIILDIINNSKKYLYITTPYLILDKEIENSLIRARRRGVFIKIIVPRIPDKKIIYANTCTYFEKLISNNIEIYLYSKGFIHSKIIYSDVGCLVSSINLDYRSFYFSLEVGVFIYKNLKVIKNDIDNILNVSDRVLLSSTKKNCISRFLQDVLRIFSIFM